MTPYYVRAAGTNKIQGVFWARNLDDLWDAVDEMCDPYGLEYANPRRPGGLWHELPLDDTPESKCGTEPDFEDGFVITPVGERTGEITQLELQGEEQLTWTPFDCATKGHGMIARIHLERTKNEQ